MACKFNSVLACSVLMALGGCLGGGSSDSASSQPGAYAAEQMRYVATSLKGRMAGTEQEHKAAKYLQDEFKKMGYADTTLQSFTAKYKFCQADKTCIDNFEGESFNVVAVKPGRTDKVLVVGAHYDSRPHRSVSNVDKGVGGTELEGLDDNASGVGVLLDVAKRLKNIKTDYTIKFVAFGAEEVGLQGSKAYVAAMSEQDKKGTVLMVNLDSLITGDHLYFHAGKQSLSVNPKAGFARDRALEIARQFGIKADTNPGLDAEYPKGTGCCSDQEVFDQVNIPVLAVEATNWYVGAKDGYQQVENTALFTDGSTWHEVAEDKVSVLDEKLPGRVAQRSADISRILEKVISETANGKIGG